MKGSLETYLGPHCRAIGHCLIVTAHIHDFLLSPPPDHLTNEETATQVK